MAFMVHTSQGKGFATEKGAVGCIAKRIAYKGVSAHAGGNPWDGCNALYAATQGLSAINAIRETFREKDIVRVHPIITQGGGAVNAIPNFVKVESYVRASSYEAINAANEKVNRALCGAALSLGANVDIEDTMGYSPLKNDEGMIRLAREAAEEVSDVPPWYSESIGSGSTDMGDLSAIMPVVHPYAPGAAGTSHGKDYKIENPELACVQSAKYQLVMLWKLLSNDGERAKEIIEAYIPVFESKEKFFEYVDGIKNAGDRIEYTKSGATVRL